MALPFLFISFGNHRLSDHPFAEVKEITEGDLAELPFLEGSISAIYHLSRILQKSHDLIFIYSVGIRDFYQ
jgi:hypothetical protein